MLDLNHIGFEELNTINAPSFKIYFDDKFLPLLLDNRERNFEDIFKNVEIQWQSLCPTSKAFYDTRYEARRQSDKKVDKIMKFDMNDIDVKQSCFDLFEAAQKTVQLSEKATCSEVLKSFKYFCDSKFREMASPHRLRQEWNDLSDAQRLSLCNQAVSSDSIKIELREQGPREKPNFNEVTKMQAVSSLCAGNFENLDSPFGHATSTSCSGIVPELKCSLCTESTIFGPVSESHAHLLLHKEKTQVWEHS